MEGNLRLKGENTMPYKDLEEKKRYEKQYYLKHDGKYRIRLENMNRKGENSLFWRGGRQKHSNGYVLIWVDSKSPFAKMRDHHSCIPEHRLVMAKYLGRCLESWELVHHINGIKTDNGIGNLELMNKNEHAILNNKTRSRDGLGRFVSCEFTP